MNLKFSRGVPIFKTAAQSDLGSISEGVRSNPRGATESTPIDKSDIEFCLGVCFQIQPASRSPANYASGQRESPSND